jgi:hypothetical protein
MKTAWRKLWSCFVQAIHRLSGDQAGSRLPSGVSYWSVSTLSIDLVPRSAIHRFNERAVVSYAKRVIGTVAIGEEVDRIADPDRIPVVRAVAGHLDHARVLEVGNPDWRRLAAAVSLPGRLPLRVRDVGEVSAIGREARLVARGQGKHRWRPAGHPDRVQL